MVAPSLSPGPGLLSRLLSPDWQAALWAAMYTVAQSSGPPVFVVGVPLSTANGMNALRDLLNSQFEARRQTLKARTAQLALREVLAGNPGSAADAVATELERVDAGAHEFAELRLLNALRTGAVTLPDEHDSAMEQLLGVAGPSAAQRLGREALASTEELMATA